MGHCPAAVSEGKSSTSLILASSSYPSLHLLLCVPSWLEIGEVFQAGLDSGVLLPPSARIVDMCSSPFLEGAAKTKELSGTVFLV